MAIDVWGQLPKSQEDPETIEEAINRIVTEHESDPEAHTGENESLAAHREFGVLDHIEGSVKADKFAFARKVDSAFDSLDAFEQSGTIFHGISSLHIRAAATINSASWIRGYVDAWAPLVFSHSWLFEANGILVTTSGNESRIGIGSTVETDGVSGVGFKISGTTLYAYMLKDINTSPVETSQSLGAFDPTIFHNYRIIFDYSTGYIRFYLDGDLVHTFTSGLPTSEDNSICIFQVKSTTAALHHLKISDFHYSSDPI